MPPPIAPIQLVQETPPVAARAFGQLDIPTAGSPVQLSSHGDLDSSHPYYTIITVQADPNNAGNIYVGWDATVASNNLARELQPGEFMIVPLGSVNNVYVDAATNGDNVNFSATR